MAKSVGTSRSNGVRQFNAVIYGGPFNDLINKELYSTDNIKNTAQRVIGLEPELGPFTPGKFVRHLLAAADLPRGMTFDQFEKDFYTIPQYLRDRVAEVMRANFHSKDPLPVLTKVSENVDKSHDVFIKTFHWKGKLYIGILYLCPNSKDPP